VQPNHRPASGSPKKIGDLAEASKDADLKVQEWLGVLASCFQLHDAVAVLELDRVAGRASGGAGPASPRTSGGPAEPAGTHLTEHRASDARVDAAAGTANTKVLLHPTKSPAVVQSRDHVATAVVDFHGRLGIERDRQSLVARRWVDAAEEVSHKVLETGAEGVDAARHLGNETLGRARSVTGKALQRDCRASVLSARGRPLLGATSAVALTRPRRIRMT
jgi:hypothetical protein